MHRWVCAVAISTVAGAQTVTSALTDTSAIVPSSSGTAGITMASRHCVQPKSRNVLWGLRTVRWLLGSAEHDSRVKASAVLVVDLEASRVLTQRLTLNLVILAIPWGLEPHPIREEG